MSAWRVSRDSSTSACAHGDVVAVTNDDASLRVDHWADDLVGSATASSSCVAIMSLKRRVALGARDHLAVDGRARAR